MPAMRTRVAGFAAILAMLLATPSIATAHAALTDSTPPADSTVLATPPEIVLTFDDPLLPDTSSFEVLDASGASLLTGHVDGADAHIMRATPGPLATGAYEVRWTAATDDGHIERGTFTFTVAGATEPPATPAPTAAPESGASSGGAVVVSIVAALVVIGGGLVAFLRRRKPAG